MTQYCSAGTSALHSAPPSPLMGVYRFRRLIDGCPAWYAIGADGQLAKSAVIRDGMSEAEAVWDLATHIYGANAGQPLLTLHRPEVVSLGRVRPALSVAVRIAQSRPDAPRVRSLASSASDPF